MIGGKFLEYSRSACRKFSSGSERASGAKSPGSRLNSGVSGGLLRACQQWGRGAVLSGLALKWSGLGVWPRVAKRTSPGWRRASLGIRAGVGRTPPRARVTRLPENCAGNGIASAPPMASKYFKNSRNIADYIYHLYLRHAIKLPVVVKSFATRKCAKQQRILVGAFVRGCARRPPAAGEFAPATGLSNPQHKDNRHGK